MDDRDSKSDDRHAADEAGADDEYIPVPVPFPLIVLLEASLAPIALMLGELLGQHPLGHFSWNWDSVWRGLIATVPMLAALALTLYWPFGPLRRIKEFFDGELRPALSDVRWYDLAILSLSAGLGEEMLFRGVAQGSAVAWLGPVAGLIVASVVFGLLHPVSPAYVVLAAILGGYLGLIYLLEGNLLTVILAHAFYDFIAMSWLLRGVGDEEPAEPAV